VDCFWICAFLFYSRSIPSSSTILKTHGIESLIFTKTAETTAIRSCLAPCSVVTTEVDCDCAIGKDLYTFFTPIQIGDFIVSLWQRSSAPQDMYSLTIYEKGNAITKRDSRFSQRWTKKLFNAWKEELFTKLEVDEILFDLHRMSGTVESE
jgi:hypothetical protein